MTLLVTIGGTARKIRDLEIQRVLDARAVCTFGLQDLDGTQRPSVGQAVVATWSGDNIFGGRVIRPSEKRLGKGGSGLWHRVTCADYASRLDHLLVAASYDAGQTAGAIVVDIFTNYVPGAEGFNTSNVDTGPEMGRVNLPRIPVSQAIREIAARAGMAWWVDGSKNVYLKARTSVAAPFSLADDGTNWYDMSVEYSQDDYRNRQWEQGGLARTSTQTDEAPKAPTPDGTAKRFFFRFPIASEPVVKLDGSTQTIGVQQLTSGKQWYWMYGQDWILQDDSEVAVQSASTLEMTYTGLYPIVARADDEVEQASRAAIEGNSGIYEELEEDSSLDDRDVATEKAEAMIRRFGTIPGVVRFSTTTAGLEPGQLIDINVTVHNLAGQYLIRSVTIRPLSSDNLEYEVECLSGEETGRWVDFFRHLVEKVKRPSIRENEQVERIVRILDGVVASDSLTVTSSAPETRIDYALIGYSEVG